MLENLIFQLVISDFILFYFIFYLILPSLFFRSSLYIQLYVFVKTQISRLRLLSVTIHCVAVLLTRDDHRHPSCRRCREEKKQNRWAERERGGKWRIGGGATGGDCAREDIMKRNPNVGRKSLVTWLRQHAIVSGIIERIGSICPWKRNTLSPRTIQE